jgi:hypothetical protein
MSEGALSHFHFWRKLKTTTVMGENGWQPNERANYKSRAEISHIG